VICDIGDTCADSSGPSTPTCASVSASCSYGTYTRLFSFVFFPRKHDKTLMVYHFTRFIGATTVLRSENLFLLLLRERPIREAAKVTSVQMIQPTTRLGTFLTDQWARPTTNDNEATRGNKPTSAHKRMGTASTLLRRANINCPKCPCHEHINTASNPAHFLQLKALCLLAP
jgi:hypothetical protein